MQEWTEEVLEPNKTLFLCFSLCSNFMTESESSPYNCRIYFFYIFCSKFQLVSPFAVIFVLKMGFFVVT